MIINRLWSTLTGQPAAEEALWLRTLFLLNVLFGLSLLWLVHYPPMVDLPQHVGQIAVLHDLLLGISPWANELKIDWVTPYLVVYLPAVFLSFVMPPLIAVKIILNLALLGFVAASLRLIRFFGGADSLRWLVLTGYFGFAWHFGFLTFLTAAPLGLFFILLAARYAQNPDIKCGLRLILFGTLLFFCHVLIFLFSAFIGGALLLAQSRLSLRWLLRHAFPYAALGCLPVAYAIWGIWFNSIPKAEMFLWGLTWGRLALLPFLSSSIQLDYGTGLLVCIAFLLPVAGLRFAREQILFRSIPFVCFLLVWLLVPAYTLDTAYLFHRFSLFALPFFALFFQPTSSRATRLTVILLILINFTLVGVQAKRWIAFEHESQDFWQAIADVPPQQRVLHFEFSSDSSSAANYTAYRHFAAWYQVEKRGWIEPNFAGFRPQLVHYRTPPVVSILVPRPATEFNWEETQASQYDYIFVRHEQPLKLDLFNNDQCSVALFSQVGTWSVFKRGACKNAL